MTAARRHPDVAIVGAGAFGAWTALILQERGLQVSLYDSRPPGHAHAASGGESRNIRAAYGAREFYTRWTIEAWDLWLQREADWGVPLLFPCGSLRCGDAADLTAQADSFARLGRPFEILGGDEAERRWPQLRMAGAGRLFYEPLSGVLAARAAIEAILRAFQAAGGELHVATVALDGASGTCALANGRPIQAGQTVLALGPWLRTLLPGLIGPLLRTPRRELFFFATDTGDTRFHWQHCPNIVDPLGWTSSAIGGAFKVAPPMRGVDMDPDDGDRNADAGMAERARQFLRSRVPDLADRPIVATYVGTLENTASEDFLIDRHPQNARLVIAGGGSGHAFKMGPVIGAYIADLVIDGDAGRYAARFGLQAHRPLQHGEGG